MKNKKRIQYGLLFLLIIAAFGLNYLHFYNSLPEKIHLKSGTDYKVEFEWPLTGEIISNNVRSQNADYTLDVKYLGLFHIKNINVNYMESNQLIPCGIPLGIYLDMDGLLVVDTTAFNNNLGQTVNPCDGILQKGDYILKINGTAIQNKEQFMRIVEKCQKEVLLCIRRGNNCFDVRVKVEKDALGNNHLGLWIKDDAQGIGTLTYIDADNNFGALGHGMNDTDCGELIITKAGSIYNAQILSITKGLKGDPGEFVGTINYNSNNRIGRVNKNSSLGLYGTFEPKAVETIRQEELCQPLDIGYKEAIEVGPAIIQTFCDGSIKKYNIIIEKVDINDKGNKGIKFVVVDEQLLELTNGIVQGMSGSPIIQNNKIIGAVTHVFVNDPTRGYGIFIETMLSNSKT